MKNLLIISYSSPPANDPAVHRIAKFAKHLPTFGWNPILLTAKDGICFREDQSNFWIEKFFAEIHRTENSFDRFIKRILKNPAQKSLLRFLMKSIALPDQFFSWKNSAVKKGLELLTTQKIDAIFATVNPYTSGLVAKKLHQISGIPFIIDYRDPWTLSQFHFINGYNHFFNQMLEKSMLQKAASIIVTSKPMKELFVRNNFFSISKTYVITNSIDDEFQKIGKSATGLLDNSKINITYSGSFYNDRQPYQFLIALADLIREQSEYKERLLVNFVGSMIDDRASKIIGERDLWKNINIIPSVDYTTSMNLLAESDILLLLNGKADHNDIFIPAKLFDYLAVGKPVLFVGKGQPAEILQKWEIGESSSHDIDDIHCKLSKIINSKYSIKNIEKFHASNTTEQLAQVLESIC